MADNQDPSTRQQLIITADPGIDDAKAILMALSHPRWHVLAIFTHYGSSDVESTTSNCQKFLAALQRFDVPVYKCSACPLVSQSGICDFYNDTGFGDEQDLPCTEERTETEIGVFAMIRVVRKYSGKINVLCLGPLTDLAIAHRLDSHFSNMLASLFMMGGNHDGHGNITRCAKLNIYFDPESAHIVLTEFKCPITLFTWELCMESHLPLEFHDQIFKIPTLKTRVMNLLESKVIDVWKATGKLVLCDELAISGLLDERSMLEWKQVPIQVELFGQFTRGQLLFDWTNSTRRSANVRVVTKMNMEVVKDLLIKTYIDLKESHV